MFGRHLLPGACKITHKTTDVASLNSMGAGPAWIRAWWLPSTCSTALSMRRAPPCRTLTPPLSWHASAHVLLSCCCVPACTCMLRSLWHAETRWGMLVGAQYNWPSVKGNGDALGAAAARLRWPPLTMRAGSHLDAQLLRQGFSSCTVPLVQFPCPEAEASLPFVPTWILQPYLQSRLWSVAFKRSRWCLLCRSGSRIGQTPLGRPLCVCRSARMPGRSKVSWTPM